MRLQTIFLHTRKWRSILATGVEWSQNFYISVSPTYNVTDSYVEIFDATFYDLSNVCRISLVGQLRRILLWGQWHCHSWSNGIFFLFQFSEEMCRNELNVIVGFFFPMRKELVLWFACTRYTPGGVYFVQSKFMKRCGYLEETYLLLWLIIPIESKPRQEYFKRTLFGRTHFSHSLTTCPLFHTHD